MTHDLSAAHHPIGSLFPGADHRSMKRYELSAEQVGFFQEHGYLSGVRILSDEQVEALRQDLAGLMGASPEDRQLFYEFHSNESTDPQHVLFHALGAWRIAPGFHDLLWHPAVTVPAAQLLGGPVRFWHDQLFCKPAHHGGVVAWHQDYSYWTRTQPLAHLTCWIALDDSSRENGCLHYIDGSHRWPANHSAHPRRATVVNVMKNGVRSASNEPLLRGIPAIPAGEQVAGQFFPLLSTPLASAAEDLGGLKEVFHLSHLPC